MLAEPTISATFSKRPATTPKTSSPILRVRWLVIDKEAFEALLKDLHTLTERLHELMRNHREKQIDGITAKTYREMILTRNSVEDLKDMLDAVTSLISTSAGTRKEKEAHLNDKTLQDLIQLKKLSRTSETILAQLKHDSTIDISPSLSSLNLRVPKFTDADLASAFEWNENETDTPEFLPRPRGILTTTTTITTTTTPNQDEGAGEDGVPVWVEWRVLGDIPAHSPRDREAGVRTVALAEMLHLAKPASLHAPECVGYFDDRETSGADRYGWLFRMPQGSDYETRVVSLHELLGDPRFRPSLSQRVGMAARLCATLLNLHAVNWLHKGVFSDNVVFHFNGEDGGRSPVGLSYDPERLTLSGFEFSRPDGTETTARDVDVVWDLYRWPGIQRQRPTERNSKKTYDLYSLGLVLLEIAHWEKLYKVMGFRDKAAGNKEGNKEDSKVPNIPLGQSKSVRDWLLGVKSGAPFEAAGRPNPLKELRHLAGDRYWKVVERCLWAHGEKGFGVEEQEDQSNDSEVGILLQEAFTVHVVEELQAVQI